MLNVLALTINTPRYLTSLTQTNVTSALDKGQHLGLYLEPIRKKLLLLKLIGKSNSAKKSMHKFTNFSIWHTKIASRIMSSAYMNALTDHVRKSYEAMTQPRSLGIIYIGIIL